MNYYQIYHNIVSNRKLNKPLGGYTEVHHILPRSLGGSDSVDNLVHLTAREHYICHLLLTKMYEVGTTEYYKVVHAYMMMCNATTNGSHNRSYRVNSRIYSKLRLEYSKLMSASQVGSNNNQFGKVWIYNPVLRISKRIDKTDAIEHGWYLGRVVDFSYRDYKCNICNKELNLLHKPKVKRLRCDNCTHLATDDKVIKLRAVNPKNKQCICSGVLYSSVGEAARNLCLNAETVRMRIKSRNYSDYSYV